MTAKLALGTVQFGLPYGVTNAEGQPGTETVAAILDLASRSGITMLDTAHAYGTAETVLGEQLARRPLPFRIITKLPPLLDAKKAERRITSAHCAAAEAAFAESLARLGQEAVHGLMLHRSADLLAEGGEALWAVLQGFIERGQVRRVGVSVYAPAETEQLMERFPLTIIQAPANLYDTRFRRAGLFRQLREAGVEVHVRSVFLQGVLLCEPGALPPRFQRMRAHHTAYVEHARCCGLTLAGACLAPFLRDDDIAFVVIGCQNTPQLQEIIAAAETAAAIAPAIAEALGSRYACDDMSIINPAEWNA